MVVISIAIIYRHLYLHKWFVFQESFFLIWNLITVRTYKINISIDD